MVYIEFVILNNLIANGVIFNFTAKTIGVQRKKFVLLSITLATVFGVVFPTVKVSEFSCAIIKFTSAIILTFLITGRVKLKRFIVALLIFYGISFCMAGATTALINYFSFLSKSVSSEELTFYILGGSVLFYLCISNTLNFVKNKKIKGEKVLLLKLKNGKSITLNSFIDTGNEVTYRQKGVVFVPKMYKDKLMLQKENDMIFVNTTTGYKTFEVYILPSIIDQDTKEEFIDVPAVFWESEKENKIILHRSM